MSYVFDTMRSVFRQHVFPLLEKAGKERIALRLEALIEEMHSVNHQMPSLDGVFSGDGMNKHPAVTRAARELEECTKEPDQLPPLVQGELTLAQAKAAHTAGTREGIECALCGRFDKIYKRKLNSGMARVLILLYKADKKAPLKWVHVLQDLPDVTGGDYGKLVEWGLVQKREGTKEDDNPDNGYYRISAKGQVFCQGQIKVPKYLYFYHDRLWPVEDDELTTIQEALGTKFNWNELMAEVA